MYNARSFHILTLKSSRVEVLSKQQHPEIQQRSIGSAPRKQFSTTFVSRLSSAQRPNNVYTHPDGRALTRQPILPNSPARTRFAPSPTGYLHIGGLRTALFSYLLAKRTGGQFLLRIEDTDQKRLVPDAEAKLCADLQWAGLQWDEGPQLGGSYGPYRQSERNEIYQQHARHLLAQGSAYRCFCIPQAVGGAQSAYVTSGCYQSCSSLSSEESSHRAGMGKEPFTVRLRQTPDDGKRTYPDLVYGKIQRLKRSPAAPLAGEDGEISTGDSGSDTILVKSDGTPTYHFANVIDDHLMRITHVIRGSEWAASTPLHYDIYSAFGWTPPQFAHVGLLVDQSGAKLSKRNPHNNLALDVASLRDQHGVLPETLCNFLALLGWSNPSNNDVMHMEQLVGNFDLKFTRGNAMVRMEKLWFLQKWHVHRRCTEAAATQSFEPIQDIIVQVKAEVLRVYPSSDLIVNGELTSLEQGTPDRLTAYCADVLHADSKNYINARDFINRNRYFFAWDPTQVPSEKEFYDKANTIGPEVLWKCAQQLLQQNQNWTNMPEKRQKDEKNYLKNIPTLWDGRGFDISKEMEANFQTSQTNPNPRAINQLEKIFHQAIEQQVYDVDAEEEQSKIRDGVLSEEIQASKKNARAALMKFLREKLAYGLPGPSVSMIMAVLGEGECRRRLGLPPLRRE